MRSSLVLGNRNYSTWSLRAWWVARRSGMRFDEIDLKLDTPEFAEQISLYSPSGTVPVLHDDGLVIWDSLAIAEYLADKYPGAKLWPAGKADRALARSLCAEMHSGFKALREQLPMNCRARHRVVNMNPGALDDIRRMTAMWVQCRQRVADSGPWLFGEWCVADAFFAPVVMRFRTYDVEIPSKARSWSEAVLGDTDIREWLELAKQEMEIIDRDEVGLVAG